MVSFFFFKALSNHTRLVWLFKNHVFNVWGERGSIRLVRQINFLPEEMGHYLRNLT